MYISVLSSVMFGIRVCPIRVEADVSPGFPGLHMIGYLASEVKEAGERVRTALKNSGVLLPAKRMTVNLAPADLRKSGALFDLPIAAALACAAGAVPGKRLSETLVIGEVGLSGEIVGVHGVLPMLEAAVKSGIKACILPKENLKEGALVPSLSLVGVSSIKEVFDYLKDGTVPDSLQREPEPEEEALTEDFSDLCGQEGLKRAAMIAAAGFHNLLLIGPPGAGKTMAAKRIPGIMPPMTREESIALTGIYSAAGQLNSDAPLLTRRPFRAPHHTITGAALIGGGAIPYPGEITLADHGVLFLDEFAECRRNVLELLRQPLEDHCVNLIRSRGRFVYPADFLLVAAMNPCFCGFFPEARCTCTPADLKRYGQRLSGPLLDRMDLSYRLQAAAGDVLFKDPKEAAGLSTEQMRVEVERVWHIQQNRFAGERFRFNGRIPTGMLNAYCPLDVDCRRIAQTAVDCLGLSLRGYHRCLRVARTIADLDGAKQIREPHFVEALGYRMTEERAQ